MIEQHVICDFCRKDMTDENYPAQCGASKHVGVTLCVGAAFDLSKSDVCMNCQSKIKEVLYKLQSELYSGKSAI